MRDYCNENPLIIERGEGSFLIDIYDNKYIDGVSSLWVNLHGHRRKEIDQAIIDQVKKISHSTSLGISSIPAIGLAKRLVEIAPEGLSKVFYSDNGSTAVEIALKMAFQYWQQKSPPQKEKCKFICLDYAYHGDTLGAVSVGGIDTFHQLYKPLLFSNYRVPSPYCYRCSLGTTYPGCQLECVNRVEEVIKEHHQEIAALIIEPLVQGAAGMIVAPSGYLKEIRELCTQYNILLIADEVAVGFGRTGTMFACEQEEVMPDLMCVAKGISGGYLPLAATLTTEEFYSAFLGEYRELRTFFHGHSYTGNPLACSAALASLDVFEKDRTLKELKGKIDFVEEKLRPFKELPHVGEVRQKGFMVGIELVKDKQSKESYPLEEKVGIRVILEARKRGLIIRPLGDVIVIMPPLSISCEDLGKLVKIVFHSIDKVTSSIEG
ncbi:MAG: adenosylmethionine--8-amino-7-oxononanoate transaminase [Deltaproteobacteria bacterium]|nr:adenosylmethionine--8-amino-7-oxononanoate transaminase [Deltaproteobacteria bacterium]